MTKAALLAAIGMVLAACSEDPKATAKQVEALRPGGPAPASSLRVESREPRMLTQVGTRGEARLTSTGKPGMLMFGPYVPWAAGRYRMVLYGEVVEARGDAGWVDVSAAQGGLQLAKASLPKPGASASGGPAGSLAVVEFALREPVADLEVRAWANEGARVAISAYEIAPVR